MGVGVGGDHGPVGVDRAEGRPGLDPPTAHRLDLVDRRELVDPHPAGQGGLPQAAGQGRRIEYQGLGFEMPAAERLGMHVLEDLVVLQELEGQSHALGGFHVLVDADILLGPVGDGDVARVPDVGVDPFGRGEPFDLVDGPVHGQVGGRGLLVPDHLGQLVDVAAHDGHGEPAVPSAGAVADHLLLEDDDVDRRVGVLQADGRPQAGVAATDDDHVGLHLGPLDTLDWSTEVNFRPSPS